MCAMLAEKIRRNQNNQESEHVLDRERSGDLDRHLKRRIKSL